MDHEFLSNLSKEDLITIIIDYLNPLKKDIENLNNAVFGKPKEVKKITSNNLLKAMKQHKKHNMK